MGSYLSKVVDELLDNSSIESNAPGTPVHCAQISGEVSEDPRSPATKDVDRTPLPYSAGLKNQAAMDPRSPCAGIPRTPLQAPLFETPPDTPESPVVDTGRMMIDPRSPNCDVQRTPIVADCEVHRTWDFDQTDEMAEGDSLYPNPPSMPAFDDLDSSLDLSSADHGSLENLLMYNSSLTEGDYSVCVSSLDGGGDEKDASSVQKILLEEVEPTENEPEPDVSPIASPTKSSTITSVKVPAVEKTKTQSTLRSSTPNRPPRQNKGLTQRDANSPLSIVQRKQVAKVTTAMTTKVSSRNNSFTVAQDKENLV